MMASHDVSVQGQVMSVGAAGFYLEVREQIIGFCEEPVQSGKARDEAHYRIVEDIESRSGLIPAEDQTLQMAVAGVFEEHYVHYDSARMMWHITGRLNSAFGCFFPIAKTDSPEWTLVTDTLTMALGKARRLDSFDIEYLYALATRLTGPDMDAAEKMFTVLRPEADPASFLFEIGVTS